ncbi:MAG: glycosyltransferase family 39 protein, partial [Anaerolineales bacterium]
MTIRETSSRKPTHWLIIIGLFVLFIIFQCLATDIRSFWEDEAYTARMIKYDSKTIVDKLAKDIHPPAYWLGVKAWANLFGFTKFGIKSFSVVWILFAFGLIYKFALDLFDKPVALVSTGLFTFSTLILTYGHTARYYSMGAALSLLAVLMAFSQIKKGKWLPLIIYVLAGALLLYTIYMGGTVLLALNIWWLLAWLRSERKILKLLEWSLAQLAILLLYAPWISFLISATRNNISVDITGINWITEIAVRIGYLGYAYSAGEFFSPLNPILWFGIILTIFIIIWAMIKWNWNLSLPLLILLVAGGISVVYTIISVYPISAWQSLPNRTLFIYPFFIIILAYGISKLIGKWFVITLTA